MPWQQILLLSMPNAAIAFTVTETKFFAPLRSWTREKSAFLGELASCGYCFGHWTAFVLVAIYRPRLFDLVGIRLLPHRSHSRLVERFSIDLALLANA
jgi:hypothetical protein